VGELGECPTVRAFGAHRINDGINGGRACWAIAGTFCQGTVQGSSIDKIRGCANCDFFESVAQEEAKRLVPVPRIFEIMSSFRG
jgi:hypothetical protein